MWTKFGVKWTIARMKYFSFKIDDVEKWITPKPNVWEILNATYKKAGTFRFGLLGEIVTTSLQIKMQEYHRFELEKSQ
jgi:hypothetical protein